MAIDSVLGVSGLTGGGSSGPLEITFDGPVSAGNGGTGYQSIAAARGGLFLFTGVNAVGDMYYRATTGTPGTLQRVAVGTTNQVLTVNASGLPQWMPAQGGTPGVGAVDSVFTRTGAVVAQTGDYTAAQVTNAVSTLGSYVDPSWITNYSYTRLINVPTSFPPAAHTHTASEITGGVLDTARLGAGAASSSVFLRGDGIWAAPPGGSGAVDSVFTRTGAVVAQSGDYTAAQVTNAVSTLGSYADPSWITNYSYTRLINVPTSFPPAAHTHAASEITGGVLDTARLGTGAASSSVFLRGDGTWAAPPGGSGAVDSVFTRTGAVVAQSGDYTAAQVTNAVSTIGSYANPAWITSLDWGKITNAPPPGGGAGPDFTTRVTINTTGGALPSDTVGTNSMLQIASAGITTLILEGQDPGSNMGVIRMRSTGGPFTSPGAVANARSLGAWYMDGHDGNGYASGAMIQATTVQAWTPTTRGTRLQFWTVRSGQSLGLTAMSIAADGGVVCGSQSAGNGPGTLTSYGGVFIPTGNLDVGSGTIMIQGEDLLQLLFATRTLVSELERKVK